MSFYIKRSDMPALELLAKQFAASALLHPNANVLTKIATYGAKLIVHQRPANGEYAAFYAALSEALKNTSYVAMTGSMVEEDIETLEDLIAIEIAYAKAAGS